MNRLPIAIILLLLGCSATSSSDQGHGAQGAGGGRSTQWKPAVSVWQGSLDLNTRQIEIVENGSGTIVGPHHVLASAHGLSETGYSIYATEGFDLANSDLPLRSAAYVMIYPGYDPAHISGDLGVAVMGLMDMVTGAPSEYSHVAQLSGASLSDPVPGGFACDYHIVGHGFNSPTQPAPTEATIQQCLVNSNFLISDPYLNTLREHYQTSKGYDVTIAPSPEPPGTLLLVSDHGPYLGAASSKPEALPVGYVCPGDSGSPLLNDKNEVVGVLGLIKGAGIEPELDFCMPHDGPYFVSIVSSLSHTIPPATMSPHEFVKRVVANCNPAMGQELCEELVSCNQAGGHYQIQSDGRCLPSCGQLARQQNIDPDNAPGKCGVWCYRPEWEDNMPWWSEPRVLGESYDCDECRYYPPGDGDLNGYDDCN
jgi:hypothetical protein